MTLLDLWRKLDQTIPFQQILTSTISNQTNLALKGMIGIQAMAVIANETGHAADAANYSSIAQEYITKWQDLAINKDANPPHTTLNYGNSSSHGMLNCNTRNNLRG